MRSLSASGPCFAALDEYLPKRMAPCSLGSGLLSEMV
jgi:hypothetical protein